ncbi:MAG: DUF4412 domain-containing protein [Chitinophagales bacterium]|nr:DUF4412 domain-containing protein [Chitinophagales bacterium]
MKRILTVFALAVLTTTAFAEKGYIITQKFVGISKTDITVSWYVSANRCKMKMLFGNGSQTSTTHFIPDITNAQLLTYNESPVVEGAQKAYYKIPIDKVSVSKDATVGRITVTKTGESKEIGGLNCEKILIKTDKHETEVWVSKKFAPEFYKYYPFFRDHHALAGLSEEKLKGFPVESVTRDLSGKTISAYQFVSATETDFTEADFKVPADYKSPEEIEGKGK